MGFCKFQKVWVYIGDTRVPAVIVCCDINTLNGEPMWVVYLLVLGVCLERSYVESAISDATNDKAWSDIWPPIIQKEIEI